MEETPAKKGEQSQPEARFGKVVLPACITGVLALVPWAYGTFVSRGEAAAGSKQPVAVEVSVVGKPATGPSHAPGSESPDGSSAVPSAGPGGVPPPERAPVPASGTSGAMPHDGTTATADAGPRGIKPSDPSPPTPTAESNRVAMAGSPGGSGPPVRAEAAGVPLVTPPSRPDGAEEVAEKEAEPSPEGEPSRRTGSSAAAAGHSEAGSGSGEDDEVRRFRKEMDRETAQFTAESSLERRAFLDEEDRQYREFVAQVEAKWGNYAPSTQPVWSSYSSDQRGHGEADFDKGTVNVEVLVDHEQGSQAEAAADLAGTLKAMMSAKNPLNRNPLQDLVDRGDGKAARVEDLTKLVQKKVQQGEVARRTVKAGDGHARTAVSIKLPMVSDRLARSARPFLPLVRQQAKRFGLDPDLVLAVIHTESYFNPFARSAAPAYGLMQLVPTSGAKEAWGFLHHVPRKVEASELYRPELNVELGTAYLHLLQNQHFKEMKDPTARVLASISAYNCGPRNTLRALLPLGGTGKTPPVGASAAEVFGALTARTPEETRQYVRLVSDRRPLWR